MEDQHRPVIATYREFTPRDELRAGVDAIFSFTPGYAPADNRAASREVIFRAGDSFSAPRFADLGASVVVELGLTCRAGGTWCADDAGIAGSIIGPAGRAVVHEPETLPMMVGAYVKPSRVTAFTGVPAAELTDRTIPIDDVWTSGSALVAELADLHEREGERIACLELALLKQMTERHEPRVNVAGLAAYVRRRRGRVSVQHLSELAGVSRHHLTRVFGDAVGLAPKVCCRLARFQAGLTYAARGSSVDWASAALELGYVDQSHMIAEFKEFSSLTPGRLVSERWFHPFIERAKAKGITPGSRVR